MDLHTRISAIARLGSELPGLLKTTLPDEAFQANDWFTRSETERAVNSWAEMLTFENLLKWTDPYRLPDSLPQKEILVVTAGNIPLVGFHDFLSVLISGNRFMGKLSSRDNILLRKIANELIRMEPRFAGLINLDGQTTPDGVIATGSNNSARYFQLQYGQLPHVFRKNRSSAAILDGTETDEDLKGLASDMLLYYGLGCRSVSHLFFPFGYSPGKLVTCLSSYSGIDPCKPFTDNHRFQQARLTMLGIPFLDAGNTLLVENESLHSRIGVVNYSYYIDRKSLMNSLLAQSGEIQCLVGHASLIPGILPFGTAQHPELWDYADQVDTLKFLNNIPGR